MPLTVVVVFLGWVIVFKPTGTNDLLALVGRVAPCVVLVAEVVAVER